MLCQFFNSLRYHIATLTAAQYDGCQKLHSKSQVTSWLTMVGNSQRSQWNLDKPHSLHEHGIVEVYHSSLPHPDLVVSHISKRATLTHGLHGCWCQMYPQIPISTWY